MHVCPESRLLTECVLIAWLACSEVLVRSEFSWAVYGPSALTYVPMLCCFCFGQQASNCEPQTRIHKFIFLCGAKVLIPCSEQCMSGGKKHITLLWHDEGGHTFLAFNVAQIFRQTCTAAQPYNFTSRLTSNAQSSNCSLQSVCRVCLSALSSHVRFCWKIAEHIYQYSAKNSMNPPVVWSMPDQYQALMGMECLWARWDRS